MMSSGRVIRRVAFWTFHKTIKSIIVLALCTFLLLYGYARWTGELNELFTVYLGGFQRSVLLAIFWLLIHLPIEGVLYGLLIESANKSFDIKLLKYRSKGRYLIASLLPLIPQIMAYYISGYVILLISAGGTSMKLVFWQIGLACFESLNIILTAFLIGLINEKMENIAFPAVVVVELVNCFLCGEKNGIFRLLPFTQGKMQLQKEYFNNGIALAISMLTLCIILVSTITIWVRKDERSE